MSIEISKEVGKSFVAKYASNIDTNIVDLKITAEVSMERSHDSRSRGLDRSANTPGENDESDDPEREMRGVLAEIKVARSLGLSTFRPTVNKEHDPDIIAKTFKIEVRSIEGDIPGKPRGLIIRPKAYNDRWQIKRSAEEGHDDEIYVLVEITPSRCTILGWITRGEGKEIGEYSRLGLPGGKPVWLVSRENLHPWNEFLKRFEAL